MKRDREYIELSEDEWSHHSDSFRPSRVLNSHTASRNPPPPPIESFTFSKTLDEGAASRAIEIIESSPSEDRAQNGNGFEDLEDEDADVGVSRTVTRGNRFVVDDDEDDGLKGGEFSDDEEWFREVEKEEKQEVRRNVTRGNRVVIDYDDDEDDGSGDLKGGEFSDDEEWFREEVKAEKDEEDVVKKALRKCEKISAELKRELYGTTSAVCDSYSEVEMGSSAARIVNQDDVNEACGSEDSEFKPILKPYQLIGVNFLLLLYRKKIGGAILADEMGLGKTVQAITYLILLKHLEDDPGPYLIVCPASVLENWERELKRWCPTFTVLQYHGSTRSAYSRELSSLAKTGQPPPFDVILVCYSIFERHSLQQKEDRKVLRQWKWSCVIMDEAHALKDKNSYRWKNLMSVARNARQRLMLTGTPLQNDLHESLLQSCTNKSFVQDIVCL